MILLALRLPGKNREGGTREENHLKQKTSGLVTGSVFCPPSRSSVTPKHKIFFTREIQSSTRNQRFCRSNRVTLKTVLIMFIILVDILMVFTHDRFALVFQFI